MEKIGEWDEVERILKMIIFLNIFNRPSVITCLE